MTALLKSDLLRKFSAGFVVGIAIMAATQPTWLAHILDIVHA